MDEFHVCSRSLRVYLCGWFVCMGLAERPTYHWGRAGDVDSGVSSCAMIAQQALLRCLLNESCVTYCGECRVRMYELR